MMRSERPSPDRLVIYDDHCDFCQHCVRFLRWFDRKPRHRYEGSSNVDALNEAGITAAEADEELKLFVRGQIHGGYDAIVEILRALPATSWLCPLLSLRPVRVFGRRQYHQIASRRSCRRS